MPQRTEWNGEGVIGDVERHRRANGEREDAGRGGTEGVLALCLTLSAADPEMAGLTPERSIGPNL
jgi:hypothetical protein